MSNGDSHHRCLTWLPAALLSCGLGCGDGEGAPERSPTSLDSAGGGRADATPPAHVVHVDSKAEWTPSQFRVEAGTCYSVNATIDDVWLDAGIEANLEGWADPVQTHTRARGKHHESLIFVGFRDVCPAKAGAFGRRP